VSEGIAHLWDHLPDAIRAKLSLARREAAGTGGSSVTVYRQEEVMKDLFDAADTRGVQIIWNAVDVRLRDIDSESPEERRSTLIARKGGDGVWVVRRCAPRRQRYDVLRSMSANR
jgi:hypothetical protein